MPLRPTTAERNMRPSKLPKRREFNCIVDDTALIAGVKRSTRDGIRKWVSQGSIRLYIPLHTLTQLNRLKAGDDRIHANAREAVKWLDEITSLSATEIDNRVQLEGVDEAYTTWAEVEEFLLPETLLSMEESESEGDEYHEDLESSFNALDVSDATSMSSTHSIDDAHKKTPSHMSFTNKDSKVTDLDGHQDCASAFVRATSDGTARSSIELKHANKSSKGVVPVYLQPLFNHVLWRINREEHPDAVLESFILLTNDPVKQGIAQKFGIRAKRLEQLRDAVAREAREFKSHLAMNRLETESASPRAKSQSPSKRAERPRSSPAPEIKAQSVSDDDDVVLFQRAPRGPAATANKSQRVFDPNDFGRTDRHPSPHRGRGGSGHHVPRGRGGTAFRGRGTFAPRGAYASSDSTFRAPPTSRFDPNQPIDPNSFTRPTPNASPMRGGGRRKLWEPN